MLARRLSVIGALTLIAALAVLAFPAPADAGVKWVTKQIGWSSTQPGAGRALASGGLDTCLITDEADSNRTVVINTSDWAWEAFLPNAATTALGQAAIITVTGQKVNAAAESLYVIIEKCMRGTCVRSALAVGTWTTSNIVGLAPFGMTAPTWGTWATGSAAYTTATAPAVMYQGQLKVDPDDNAAQSGLVWGVPEFRLHVIGDIGGTTPQVNAARVYLTYPQRSQP